MKNFNQFINENTDLKSDFAISNLFRKYEKDFEPEFNDENWIGKIKESIKGLYESLTLIGNGEITVKSPYDIDGDRLMYKEMLKNDTLILVVHAAYDKHPYGGPKLYRYEIGVYVNNPRTQQIGGGYGASGIMSIVHTNLLSSIDNYSFNRNVISKVCTDIKKYAEENF